MTDYLTAEHRARVDAWNAAHPKRPAERVDIDAGGHPDQAPAEPAIPRAVAMMCETERVGAVLDQAFAKREMAWPADLIVARRLELTKPTDEN